MSQAPGTNPAVQAGIRMKLSAGHPGSRRYHQQFGDALVCVRYRIHPQTAKRYTTVEIVVDERQFPTPAQANSLGMDEIVAVGISIQETRLWNKVQQAGARWDDGRQAWLLPLRMAQHLGLHGRVERLVK